MGKRNLFYKSLPVNIASDARWIRLYACFISRALSARRTGPLLFCLIGFFLVMLLVGVNPANATSADKITHYKDIPGITAAEVSQIEAILAEKKAFHYGSLFSTESFTNREGEFSGYTKRFCARLSSLFGIAFQPALYDWDELTSGLANGTIDFSGDLTPTTGRKEQLFMTHPVAERSLTLFSKAKTIDIYAIARKRPPKLVFLANSVHFKPFQDAFKKPFEAVFVENFEMAIRLVENETVDAFISESISESYFMDHESIFAQYFFPLIRIPASLATQNQQLLVFITVINKYLDNGGQAYLSELYTQGMNDYSRHHLMIKFTAEEKAYIDRHSTKENAVRVFLENDNYPKSFYNHEENEFEGIVPDLLAQVGDLTNLKFTPVNSNTSDRSEALALLSSGKAAMISELLYSEARAKDFIWTDDPYCSTSYAFISRQNYPDLGIYQVLGKKTGVLKDTLFEDNYRQWFPGREPVLFDTMQEAFVALEKGHIDLYLASEHALLIQTNYYQNPGFKINPIVHHQMDCILGFNKQQTLLRSIINKTQPFTKANIITKRWESRSFDYVSTLSKSRNITLAISCVLLLVSLFMLAMFFARNYSMRKKLEKTVKLRTQELEEQTLAAQAASQAKGSFLAKMSHEIRTPLNAIIGMSEVTKNSISNPEKALASINRVLSSSHHLLGVINDVLDMSKIEAGKLELSQEAFRLYQALDEVCSIISSRCQDNDIHFCENIEISHDCVIIGDELHLKQALINLLGNAVKFTESKGCVEFNVIILEETAEAIHIKFEVKDNGIGMTQEHIVRLFTPFEQADASIALRFGGTGLGLSISQKIVNMMGSQIQVQSAPGQGASFSFELNAQKGLLRKTSQPDLKSDLDFRDYRILLVEDVEVNRMIVRELLSATQIQIEDAENGKRALQMFETAPEHYYNFIFMDVQMPEMDGYEATRSIRALNHPQAKSIPIVAMTANAYKEDVDKALACGMNAHLAKPINIASLLAMLRQYLQEEPDQEPPLSEPPK